VGNPVVVLDVISEEEFAVLGQTEEEFAAPGQTELVSTARGDAGDGDIARICIVRPIPENSRTRTIPTGRVTVLSRLRVRKHISDESARGTDTAVD
jgi:hypothetical protein